MCYYKNDYDSDYIENCAQETCYCSGYIKKPTMPPIPKDDEETDVPSAPSVVRKKSFSIIPYSTQGYGNIDVDQDTGKAQSIQSLCFGNYPHTIWLDGLNSIDSFTQIGPNSIHSFILPENISIEKITASIRVQYTIDLKDTIFRIKIRLYRSDFDKNTYNYIEGTQVELTPVLTGIVDENDTFLAETGDMQVLVEAKSKFLFGLFCEAEKIDGQYGISVRVEAGLAVSIDKTI